MQSNTTLPRVRTAEEARTALGSEVWIQGTVRREKLGDSIQSGEFNLLCPDFELPDELVRQEAAVAGRVENYSPPVAEVGPDGAISQGTEMPSSRLVLRDCRQVDLDQDQP